MAAQRFLQFLWLVVVGGAVALAAHDSSQNLHHPAVLLTARAEVVLWFCSAGAGYVTGQRIECDGGGAISSY